jgi:hypothetical protein
MKPECPYFQDLETLIRDLDTNWTNEILSNDKLRAQLKWEDKAFLEQEEKIKKMWSRFEAKDK